MEVNGELRYKQIIDTDEEEGASACFSLVAIPWIGNRMKQDCKQTYSQ